MVLRFYSSAKIGELPVEMIPENRYNTNYRYSGNCRLNQSDTGVYQFNLNNSLNKMNLIQIFIKFVIFYAGNSWQSLIIGLNRLNNENIIGR